MYGSYMPLIYSKYSLFYESSTNLGYFAHIQTVCTRPLLGGEGRGGKSGTSLVHYKPSSQCTCHYVPSPQGYLIPLETRVGVLMLNEKQLKRLFGNINEIRVFNR